MRNEIVKEVKSGNCVTITFADHITKYTGAQEPSLQDCNSAGAKNPTFTLISATDTYYLNFGDATQKGVSVSITQAMAENVDREIAKFYVPETEPRTTNILWQKMLDDEPSSTLWFQIGNVGYVLKNTVHLSRIDGLPVEY